MKGSSKPRPGGGAVRKGKKGPQVGSGGQGRQALEGRKPTPKAEDRPYHPAGKAKKRAEQLRVRGGRGARSAGGGRGAHRVALALGRGGRRRRDRRAAPAPAAAADARATTPSW